MNDIFNLAGRLGKAAFNHAKDGFKHVDEEIYNKRIEICKSCEFYDAESNRCKSCGCYLAMKAKWNSEKCPHDKW